MKYIEKDYYYIFRIVAWTEMPEPCKVQKTNKEAFFDYVRSELEAKIKVWENMSEEEFMEWLSVEDSQICFYMGRELSWYKMGKTNAISVGTAAEVNAWLKKEAR